MKNKTDSQHAFSDLRLVSGLIASAGGIILAVCLLPAHSRMPLLSRTGRNQLQTLHKPPCMHPASQ